MSAQPIFQLQADLCRAMGHPVRLQIVHLLREGPKRVNELVQDTGLDQGTVSRNLGILRRIGVLTSQREGNQILYQIANPKLMEVCDLMRQVLEEQAIHSSEIWEAMDDEPAG